MSHIVARHPYSTIYPVSYTLGKHLALFYQLESSGIQAIPRILEESILAQGPAKLIKKFWWNVEWNSNSAGMVLGITWMECTQNDQEWNPPYNWHPNWVSAFANTQFGHHQQSFSSSSTTTTTTTDDTHPLSPHLHHRHHHIIVITTNSCHHPHPSPHNHHLPCHQWVTAGHVNTMDCRMPCRCQQCANQTTNEMTTTGHHTPDHAQMQQGFAMPHCQWWCGNQTTNDDIVHHRSSPGKFCTPSPITFSHWLPYNTTTTTTMMQHQPQWQWMITTHMMPTNMMPMDGSIRNWGATSLSATWQLDGEWLQSFIVFSPWYVCIPLPLLSLIRNTGAMSLLATLQHAPHAPPPPPPFQVPHHQQWHGNWMTNDNWCCCCLSLFIFPSSNMESRCHIAYSDMATKWQMTHHLSSLIIV